MVHLVAHVEENEGMSVTQLKDQVEKKEGMLIALLKHELEENHDGKHQEQHPHKMTWTECKLVSFG